MTTIEEPADKELSDEDFDGLKIAVCLALIVVGPLVWGVTFKTLWNWVATQPPFGMPDLNLLSAIGVGLIAGLFSRFPDSKSRSLRTLVSNAFQRWLLYALLLGIFAFYRTIL